MLGALSLVQLGVVEGVNTVKTPGHQEKQLLPSQTCTQANIKPPTRYTQDFVQIIRGESGVRKDCALPQPEGNRSVPK